MSMSLRDQLLAAGLVSQKQVRDAERQQQHQQRGQQRPPPHRGHKESKPGQTPASSGQGAVGSNAPVRPSAPTLPSAAVRNAAAQSAKVARDLALNKKQQERAEQKARAAQIKQLVEQNRIVRGESDERYNFVDGGRIRFIAANAEVRRRLTSGEVCIVRHERFYDVVPAAVAQRIRERDARAVVDINANAAAAASAETASMDDAYKDFAVPDDLMW